MSITNAEFSEIKDAVNKLCQYCQGLLDDCNACALKKIEDDAEQNTEVFEENEFMKDFDWKAMSATIEDCTNLVRDFGGGKAMTGENYKVCFPFSDKEYYTLHYKGRYIADVDIHPADCRICPQFDFDKEELFSLIKAVESATGKLSYPDASLSEHHSWEGHITDKDLKAREHIVSAVNLINAAIPLNTEHNTKALIAGGYEALEGKKTPFDFRIQTFDGEKMRYFDFSLVNKEINEQGYTRFIVCEDWCKTPDEANIVIIPDSEVVKFLNGNSSIGGILCSYARPEPSNDIDSDD